MPIKDQELIQLIEKINNHFTQNINNRFLRKAFLHMKIPQSVWDTLDGIDEKASYRTIQGYSFEEVYEIIVAGATFIHNAKNDIKPRLKSILDGSQYSGFTRSETAAGANDKIFREMAVNNFSSNFSIFSDQINELYMKTVKLDKESHKNQKCVFEKIPELKQVGQLLIES